MVVDFAGVKQLLANPRAFYEARRDPTIGRPLVFALIHYAIAQIITLIISIPIYATSFFGILGLLAALVAIPLALIILPIVLFIWTGFVHLGVLVMGGKGKITGTFAAQAYTIGGIIYVYLINAVINSLGSFFGYTSDSLLSSLQNPTLISGPTIVFFILSLIVSLAIFAYTIYLEATGLSVYHNISLVRGIVAVLLPLGVLAGFIVILMLLVAPTTF